MRVAIQSKLESSGTSIFAVMSGLANEYSAINLSQGFPDFSIDPLLQQCVVQAMEEGQVQYSPMPGRLDLREAISEKIQTLYNTVVDAQTEITITAGGTQAIYCALTAIVNAGDEVIIFDPAYDCYDPAVRLNGGIPVHLNLKYPDYRIDWDELSNRITPRTKLIMFNNPHNPTGTVWSTEDLARLQKIVTLHPDILLLSDEVYEHIHFGERHHSFLENPLLMSRSFVVFSFGKTFHVTGWKVGYCVAPPELTSELRRNFQFNTFCVNNTMQCALAKYMRSGDTWTGIPALYSEKLDLFQNLMTGSRFRKLPCKGTYFCLYDYSAISDARDTDFAKILTREFGVASIPLSVFYQDGSDHKILRFCFAKKTETLKNAAALLCKI